MTHAGITQDASLRPAAHLVFRLAAPNTSPRLASQLTAPHVTGNYLIASSIQSIAEAMALAEKNGLDRVQVDRVQPGSRIQRPNPPFQSSDPPPSLLPAVSYPLLPSPTLSHPLPPSPTLSYPLAPSRTLSHSLQVMNMLSSTIFDCLIYKGYGQRVSERDHKPGGFALELGLKVRARGRVACVCGRLSIHVERRTIRRWELLTCTRRRWLNSRMPTTPSPSRQDVALVKDTAARSGVPMPVASVLHDRWLAAYAKGRGEVDWSAVALSTSEDSGVDVSAALAKAMRAVEEEKAAR